MIRYQSTSPVREMLDRCCPGWNDMAWKQPCTAPITMVILSQLGNREMRHRQLSLCTALRRYFSREKQKAMLFYWHSRTNTARAFWLVVHYDVGVMQFPDFYLTLPDPLPTGKYYDELMSLRGRKLLEKWNWSVDFFTMQYENETNSHTLIGFQQFNDLKQNRCPFGNRLEFEDTIVEIFEALLSTGYVYCSKGPFWTRKDDQITDVTNRNNRALKRTTSEEDSPAKKMENLFPGWSDPDTITCYVYPPVFVPLYQGPTKKRLQQYEEWRNKHKSRGLKLDSTMPQPEIKKRLEESAKNDDMQQKIGLADGAAAEYLALDTLRRAFTSRKEKFFIISNWKFPINRKSAEDLQFLKDFNDKFFPAKEAHDACDNRQHLREPPDVDILVIHKQRGMLLFEVKGVADVKDAESASKQRGKKAKSQLDQLVWCLERRIGVSPQHINSFKCFPLLNVPFKPDSDHRILDKAWLDKLRMKSAPIDDLWPTSKEQADMFQVYKSTVEKMVQSQILGYSVLAGYDVLEKAGQLKGIMPSPPPVFNRKRGQCKTLILLRSKIVQGYVNLVLDVAKGGAFMHLPETAFLWTFFSSRSTGQCRRPCSIISCELMFAFLSADHSF